MNFPNGVLPQMELDNLHLLTGIPVHEIQEQIVHNIQRTRKRFNRNLDLYLSDSESGVEGVGGGDLPRKLPRRFKHKKQEQESIIDEEEEMENDANRIHYLDNEISRLQNLCRENFGTIDSLRKENARLTEIHSELKDTTTDLAYSLAQCPWWERDEFRNTALHILTAYTQNIQYILELPTFIDPVEQLETSGRSKEKAIQLLRKSNAKKVTKKPPPKLFFKCRKCNKYFTSENRFKTHTAIHSAQKKLWCKTCGSNFPTFSTLREHQKIHENVHANPSLIKTVSNCNFNSNVCISNDNNNTDCLLPDESVEILPDLPQTNGSDSDICTKTINGNNNSASASANIEEIEAETISTSTVDKLKLSDLKIDSNVESESSELNNLLPIV